MIVQIEVPDGIFERVQREQADRGLRSPRATVRQILIERYSAPYEKPVVPEENLRVVKGKEDGCFECKTGRHCGNTVKDPCLLPPDFKTKVLVLCQCKTCKPEETI